MDLPVKMKNRPVFVPERSENAYVCEISIQFYGFPGNEITQKQRSIVALHSAAQSKLGIDGILEISSKSNDPLGVSLSAFNLMLPLAGHGQVPVEVAYQASKHFDRGGPYLDLLYRASREAKADTRLKTSGRLLRYNFGGDIWPPNPKTAFYDWLYVSALRANPAISQKLLEFRAFTDIEFNPHKSVNCQARSAALYVCLHGLDLLTHALESRETFLALFLGTANEPVRGNSF